MLLALLPLFSAIGSTLAATLPKTLVLKCNEYPGVCDTHCYAAACTSLQSPSAMDVNRYLHYAEEADQWEVGGGHTSSESASRRTAIGCASSGCADKSVGANKIQCDEFPYASTYEGGLGCHIRRYKGTQTPAKWGVWHCTSQTDNGSHGNHLKLFYANMRNNDPYQVAFDEANVDNAPLCRAIRQTGKSACGAARGSNWETKTSTTAYCPRVRGWRRRDEFVEEQEQELVDALLSNATTPAWDIFVNRTAHTVSDAHGGKLWYPFGGPPPSGSHVYRLHDNGTSLHQSHVV